MTCPLLIEKTVGLVPKFASIGYFCDHLVTSALLMELSRLSNGTLPNPISRKLVLTPDFETNILGRRAAPFGGLLMADLLVAWKNEETSS